LCAAVDRGHGARQAGGKSGRIGRTTCLTQAAAAVAPPAATPATLRKVIAASLIGTTIEWYDFFLYGTAAALVFNRL